MVSKVIFEIKFISIAINLYFDPHKSFLEIFYVCFKFNAVRFDIVFKGPQNDRTKTLLGSVALKCVRAPTGLFPTFCPFTFWINLMVEETDC